MHSVGNTVKFPGEGVQFQKKIIHAPNLETYRVLCPTSASQSLLRKKKKKRSLNTLIKPVAKWHYPLLCIYPD